MRKISFFGAVCVMSLGLLIAQDNQEMQIDQESQKMEDFQEVEKQNIVTSAQRKSGFVIGVEALFGSSKASLKDLSLTSSHYQKAINFSVSGGVYGGYQHYFNQNFGIRVLLTVHDATPILGKFEVGGNSIETSALPFWVGTEFDVLWDFWESGDHVLGLSVGLGYNFELYWDRWVKPVGTNDTQRLSANYQHNLYPILGFHYYYGHHQMSLNYRFIGSLDSPIKKDTITIGSTSTQIEARYTFEDYLNFSYSYRF